MVKNEKTLVIPLTNNDVEDVKLQPKDKWSGHAFRKGNVTKIGEQYWLELNFEEKLPEQVIQRIDLKDKFGNSNDHLFSNNSMVPYHVEVESPEVTSVSAFTSRLVELHFSHRVNSIGSVKAIKDGKETILKIKKFDSAFVDNTVVVEFADILPSGVYTLVFENVRRSAKSFAVSKELKVEGLSNQKTNFLVSPFFSHANHLNVELSTALDVNKLKISAAKSIDEGTDEYNLLVNGTDIKIELSAMTERGTVFAKIWPLKADKFISQSDEQKLQISIDDDEKKDFLLSWSTKPIAVLPELTNVTASSINIRFAQEIDCNMVSFEVFDNQGKPVEINKPSASVSPYYSYYLLLKTPFENKLAKGHYRIVLTNVKSAAFGFANSNPIEFEFEIK
ncbi:MAG: hypothetical protein EOP04_11465 [Proteobacteria bacterium]|nr:MAG: hypothetical protein EOP04_11465 [Pseudomonadota bacterium]